MPFTPLHLGAGAAFKALGGRHFSFMVFGGTQVLMDLEPLVGMIRGSDVLHGYTHTLAGALAIGFAGAVTGRPVTNALVRGLRWRGPPVTWTASFIGAYVGSLSHILLDALMHSDMRPFWPLTSKNPLLLLIDIDHLGLLCVLLGIAGGIAISVRQALRRANRGFIAD